VSTLVLDTLPWQADFLEDVSERRVVIGGVGSGKSIIGADQLIDRCEDFPHGRHYVIGSNHPMMKEGTIPTLCERLDVHGYKYELNGGDLSIRIISGPAKGARIIAWTVEGKKYLKLKSQMIDSCWLDECQVWENGESAYNFIVNRMRPSEPAQMHHPDLEPRLWMTANPPHTTAHWLYRYFVTESKAKLYHVTTFDNWLLPQRDAYIQRLRETYSPELFDIEVMGKWGDLGIGRAYPSFDHTSHVDAAVAYDPELPLYWTHDFGVSPRVSILCQVRRVNLNGFQREVLYCFDEISMNDGSTDGQIEEFVLRYPPSVVSSLTLLGDPAGQARNSTTGRSDWAMLTTDPRLSGYRGSVNRKAAAPLVVDRVNAMNSKLRNAKGEQGIRIHPKCKKLIEDMQTTRWKDGVRQLDHGTPARGIFRTHWSDALGYLVEIMWPITNSGIRVAGNGWMAR